MDENGNYVRDCEFDEIGCICIRGPNVLTSYFDDKHNHGRLIDDGWFNTEDLGRQDKEGYFWCLGRSNFQIKSNGRIIEPAWIEDVLEQHPDVDTALAIGMPHYMYGQVPIAYVSLITGDKDTGDELKEFCKKNTNEDRPIPFRVIVLDQLPVTKAGKLDKLALIRDATRRTIENELNEIKKMGCELSINVDPDPLELMFANIKISTENSSILDKANNYAMSVLEPFRFKFSISLVNTS